MLNKNKLNQIFDVNTDIVSVEIEKTTNEEEKKKTPDEIIYENIDKANLLLDKIISSVTNIDTTTEEVSGKKKKKDINARLLEVAGQLIDKITSAANSISSTEIDYADIQLKHITLLNKQKELDWKMNKNPSSSEKNTEKQVIITDRETILNMIKNKKEIE